MKTFGLSESDYKLFTNLVINPLKALPAKVYIFGSRARGKHHPFSDIDVLYEIQKPKSTDVTKVSAIAETIEESLFPIKVDLVSLQDLAKSYRDKVLIERIEV